MKVKVYKLKFPHGVHIGLGRSGYDKSENFIHSDTLAGAIAVTLSKLKGRDSNNLFVNPLWRLSSAFPFWKDMLFFPKPQENIFSQNLMENFSKQIKKIHWIELSLLEEVRRGKILDEQDVDLKQAGQFLIPASRAAENKGPIRVFYSVKIQRVTIDRLKSESEPFLFQEIKFAEDAGLFFMVDFEDEDAEKIFDTAMEFLADEGIGSDRSVGKGWFTYEKSEMEIEVKEGGALLLLSLLIPTREDIDNLDIEKSKFILIKRGGWVTNGNLSLRKKAIWAIGEGSVLYANGGISGKSPLVLSKNDDLGLAFDVYRWGKPFFINWKE